MRTEFDGIGKPIGAGHHILHQFFFLRIDVKIGPGRYGNEQGQSDRKNQLGRQLAVKIFDVFDDRHIHYPQDSKIINKSLNPLRHRLFQTSAVLENLLEWMHC
jgi:hypothetical protein